MAQQGTVTITGFVGADPISFGREGGTGACSFRVGSTRSYFYAASGEWKDHPTTWITIKAFRTLAANILASVRKGDPIIVTGLLNTEEWQQDGNNRSRIVIEANAVGHDLARGTGTFQRQSSRRAPVLAQSTGQAAKQPQDASDRDDNRISEFGYASPPSNGDYAPQHPYSESRANDDPNGEKGIEDGGNIKVPAGEDPWTAGTEHERAGEPSHAQEFASPGF
ncbi:MAG: single-stranded DNA-binding protein [Bifidobacterium sp.]|jgi:single-strand DNA-binding protein|nr:single-stranded DNA-binding protein [Bifidobacterium sp.]